MDCWKRKLGVQLHDPPEKCLDIKEHEQMAETYYISAGMPYGSLTDEEKQELHDCIKAVDHFAAAADRFAFPQVKCSSKFTGKTGETFRHPLCSEEYTMDSLKSTAYYSEILASAIGGVETSDPKTVQFLLWRRWLENAMLSDKKVEALAFFPADTRIPDHTIWNHNTLASALAPCWKDGKLKPAMLLFQLGPVQDFIAQARSTRDLWSGSYLLSWLIAHAMKAISDEIGPDTIIFPNLRGNGIFDALHKDTIYKTTYKNGENQDESLWKRMVDEKGDDYAKWLLTPTLPNRFLAIVPEDRAEELAHKAELAIKKELVNIGDAVWKWIEEKANFYGCKGIDQWKIRWDKQLDAFPQITWAFQPWLDRDECLEKFEELPVNNHDPQNDNMTPYEQLNSYFKLAEEWLTDKDNRFYTNGKLNNEGILWSAHYALVDAKLAARRNTRDFLEWKDPSPEAALKDSLSGKEECIGDERFWTELVKDSNVKVFSIDNHRYGSMNLIKRLWCRSQYVPYLNSRLGLNNQDQFEKDCGFDSVPDVAKMNTNDSKYVAILAMDGDNMGKWVSGENTPLFLNQLSLAAQRYLRPVLAEHSLDDKLRRLLTPSYHLQFSEALANFATWLAEPIVAAHDGQLIYAGGDDVLAMLPATKAIACAEALNDFFCGKNLKDLSKYKLSMNGFAKTDRGIPMTVPGTRCTTSIGIAIGHMEAPLQMLVKEAQKAESRAKHEYGRNAIAFSVYKRSGEIIQWGCKWTSNALPLMEHLAELSRTEDKRGHLSGRFPYALLGLLTPYQLGKNMDSISKEELAALVEKELKIVIRQQSENMAEEEKDDLLKKCCDWLKDCQQELDGQKSKMEDFVKPFLTETFINRSRGE